MRIVYDNKWNSKLALFGLLYKLFPSLTSSIPVGAKYTDQLGTMHVYIGGGSWYEIQYNP